MVDPQLLSEAGRDMLVARIPSSNKIDQRKFQPGMFNNLQAGSLLVVELRPPGEPPGCNIKSGTGWLLQTVQTCAAHRHEDPGLQRQANSAEPLPQVPLVLNHGAGASRGPKTGCSRHPLSPALPTESARGSEGSLSC